MLSVPIVSALDAIYPPEELLSQAPRWNALATTFTKLYGRKPDFVARSPGRVNVIGEHIDYSLYPVLPMAISADALLAVARGNQAQDQERGGQRQEGQGHIAVRIANVDGEKFAAREFSIAIPSSESEDVCSGIDASVHEWSNYFRAGMIGALRLLRKKGIPLRPTTLDLVMDGNVPAGGGLSSSAAFVSASSLAVLAALQGVKSASVDKNELTEVAIVSEREVGVNSGGMDQSASILAERDAALLVSFYPKLNSTPVLFPATDPAMSFVVAQSFVVSDKHVTGPVNYNLRVVECTLAAEVLQRALNPLDGPLPTDSSPLGVSLRGFHERYFETRAVAAGKPRGSLADELEELISVVEDSLPSEAGYTLQDIAQALGATVDAVSTRHLSSFPVRAEYFKLRQRALHVYSEALRVQRFMALLSAPPDTNLPARLGELLNQSQSSCRQLYECSCPEIDEICATAIDAGALGSRVTGAGWGGCSVHLVPEPVVEALTSKWDQQYYRPRGLDGRDGKVVVTKPGMGSVLFVGVD